MVSLLIVNIINLLSISYMNKAVTLQCKHGLTVWRTVKVLLWQLNVWPSDNDLIQQCFCWQSFSKLTGAFRM